MGMSFFDLNQDQQRHFTSFADAHTYHFKRPKGSFQTHRRISKRFRRSAKAKFIPTCDHGTEIVRFANTDTGPGMQFNPRWMSMRNPMTMGMGRMGLGGFGLGGMGRRGPIGMQYDPSYGMPNGRDPYGLGGYVDDGDYDVGRGGYGGDGGRDRLCGFCGDWAHPGPCGRGNGGGGDDLGGGGGGDNGGRGFGGGRYSRPRYMRGGGPRDPNRDRGSGGGNNGFSSADIANGLRDLKDAINNHGATSAVAGGPNAPAGCGPSCAVNDGSFRVRGNVGDHNIDLKLGGTPQCPCDAVGGCEASHRRARSRSRSRKRRDRRSNKRHKRREPASLKDDDDVSSCGTDISRGRRMERGNIGLRGGGGGDSISQSIRPRLSQLEEDVQKLNQILQSLKYRIPDLARYGGRPEMGNDDAYDTGGFWQGLSPEPGEMSRRPRLRRRGMPRAMRAYDGVDGTRFQGGRGTGRYDDGRGRNPMDDYGLDTEADMMEDSRRDRETQAHDDGPFNGLANIDEDEPLRFGRARRGRGFARPRDRGMQAGPNPGLNRRQPRPYPEDETMRGGRNGMPTGGEVQDGDGEWHTDPDTKPPERASSRAMPTADNCGRAQSAANSSTRGRKEQSRHSRDEQA